MILGQSREVQIGPPTQIHREIHVEKLPGGEMIGLPPDLKVNLCNKKR